MRVFDRGAEPPTPCPLCGVRITEIYAEFEDGNMDPHTAPEGGWLGYSVEPCGHFLGHLYSYEESGRPWKTRRGSWVARPAVRKED